MVAQRFRQSDFVMRSGTSVLHSSYGSFLTSNLLLDIIAHADTLVSLLREKLHTFGGVQRHDYQPSRAKPDQGPGEGHAAACPAGSTNFLDGAFLTPVLNCFEFRHQWSE